MKSIFGAVERVSILLWTAGALAHGTAAELPTVIDSCYYFPPPPKSRLCQSWVRQGDKFEQIGGGNAGLVNVQQFDAGNATFIQSGGTTQIYSGKVSGNRIEGIVTIGPPEYATPFKWSAKFFYSPTGNPATGRHVYATCGNKVSIINTANHAVTNVSVDDPGKPIGPIVVSADSSKAYVSTLDSAWKANIFFIDVVSATVTRKLPLQGTIPSGARSLALSGDGSTLYAFGLDTKGTGYAIIVIDVGAGAVKALLPLPQAYSGGGGFVVSGSRLVLDDGTVVDLAVPAGATAVYSGDNGRAVSPDGTKTYRGGQQLRSEEGTPETNPNFGAVVGAVWGRSVGITADGKTLYTTAGTGPVVYTIDVATGLTTDAIRVCENPGLIVMEPFHGRIGAPR